MGDRMTRVAGVAWLVGAALTLYLATQQNALAATFNRAGLRLLAGPPGLFAIVNIGIAIGTFVLALALLRRPSRTATTWSLIWVAVTIAAIFVQFGALTGLWFGIPLAALVAGFASLRARDELD